MRFAELLREQRKAKGFTQDDLAKAAGITQAGISRYESGIDHPGWAEVQAIAKALGVSCTVFVETEEKKPQVKAKPKPKAKSQKTKTEGKT